MLETTLAGFIDAWFTLDMGLKWCPTFQCDGTVKAQPPVRSSIEVVQFHPSESAVQEPLKGAVASTLATTVCCQCIVQALTMRVHKAPADSLTIQSPVHLNPAATRHCSDM